ncbi:MAG: hypothetical protein ACI9VR_001993 [Cognaticolwellia sp.]|jgi:hypothetical protein
MRIEDLRAELRPRTSWEAMDLGLRLLREWWRPVFAAWFCVIIPVFVVGFGVTWWAPWLGAFLIWCAQPLWDRVVLHVISRGLFGAVPTLSETLRALPGLLFRGWPQAFVARLDPTRVFVAPVYQLEDLRGGEASRRKSVLRARSSGAALTLSTFCWGMEMLVAAGVVGFVFMALPQTPAFNELLMADLEDWIFPAWLQLVFVGAWMVAHTLIEPLHVAAGFGLYVNRRTHLEGWDVEIQFRQLARRLARIGAVSALLLVFGAGFSGLAQAQDGLFGKEQVHELGDLSPTQAVEGVLADPDFSTTETQSEWVRKGQGQSLSEWLKGCSQGEEQTVETIVGPDLSVASGGLQALLWGLMAVGVVFFLVLLFRGRGGGGLKGLLERPLPGSRSGVEAPQDRALPPNLPQVARGLWEEGQHAMAVGLLYQGAVADLVRRGLPIDEGATEGECLRVVRRQIKGEPLKYFRALTSTWQTLAYAHRSLNWEQVAPLFERWSSHFSEEAA